MKSGNNSNFVYISLLKQLGNSDFEFISVSFSAVAVGNIRYQPTVPLKSYDLKIKSFCFYKNKTKHFNRRKIHSGLFLSLAITGTDINDIIRYPSSSLKYHLTRLVFSLSFRKKNSNLYFNSKFSLEE